MAGALTTRVEQSEYERGFAAGYKAGFSAGCDNVANVVESAKRFYDTNPTPTDDNSFYCNRKDVDGEAVAYNKREES